MTDDKEKQYSELLQGLEATIVRVCRRYSRHDDYHFAALYQEVTYALWQEWRRHLHLRHPARLKGWVYRLACNTAIDYMQRCRGRLPCEPLESDEADLLLPPCNPSEEENLEELLATLSPYERHLLTLSLQGYHYKEIAAMERLSVSAVGARLSRILDKLRQEAGTTPRPDNKNNNT